MGIITVLCKGLVCSAVHIKCSQPYDFQSCVTHLFLQGKLNVCSCRCSWCLSRVSCYASLPWEEIMHRAAAFPARSQPLPSPALGVGLVWGISRSRMVSLPLRPTPTQQQLAGSPQERRPTYLQHMTQIFVPVCLGKPPIHWHKIFCARSALILQKSRKSAFFQRKKPNRPVPHLITSNRLVRQAVSHISG